MAKFSSSPNHGGRHFSTALFLQKQPPFKSFTVRPCLFNIIMFNLFFLFYWVVYNFGSKQIITLHYITCLQSVDFIALSRA